MNRIFLADFKKTLKLKRFWFAAIICIFTAFFNLSSNIGIRPDLLNDGTLNIFLFSTLFDRSFFSYTAPIIAVIPFSIVIFEEMKSGFIKQILLRTKTRVYLISRILTNIVFGMLPMLLGLVIFLLISWLIGPSPSFRIYPVFPLSPFAYVYETSMLFYVLLFILNSAIFTAAYAILGAGIFIITKNAYLGYIIPVCFYTLSTLSLGVFWGINILPFSTFQFMSTTTAHLIRDHILVIIIGLILIIIGFIRWRKAAAE